MQKYKTLVQSVSLVLLHSSWGLEVKWFCNPVLSCHSCALSYFACPIGVFAHFAGHHVFPLLALGTVLLIGVLVGRLLCGWVCPFGFLQDLLYRLKTRKFTLPAWTGRTKYAVLVLTVFALPFMFGEETVFSFCRYCPAAAAEVSLPAVIGGALAGEASVSGWSLLKIGILAAVVAAVIFSRRAFCNVLCPIGALLAPLNFVSLWAVRPPTSRCIACKKCDRACVAAVEPSARIAAGESPSRAADCVVCHQCQPACPVKDAPGGAATS